MPMLIEKLKIRVPMVEIHGIETNWVEALVFERAIAIHPSLNNPGAGIWTVTLARCGQGIVHLPSQVEAMAFATELLKEDLHLDEVIDYRTVPSEVIGKLTLFVGAWGAKRAKVMPRYMVKTIPEGIKVEGWDQMQRGMDQGTVLGPDGLPVGKG